MTGTCQTVAAHSAIIFMLISSLAIRRQTNNDVAGTYVCVVDDIRTFHTASHCRVDDNRAYEVADIGSLASSGVYAYAHLAHLLQQLVGAVNNG